MAKSCGEFELNVSDATRRNIFQIAGAGLKPLLLVTLKADTPGCNKQLLAANDLLNEGFLSGKCAPIGVVIGTITEVERWVTKRNLKFPVIQGTPEFLESLGCYSKGKAKRCCLLVDRNGEIEWSDFAVKGGASYVEGLKAHLGENKAYSPAKDQPTVKPAADPNAETEAASDIADANENAASNASKSAPKDAVKIAAAKRRNSVGKAVKMDTVKADRSSGSKEKESADHSSGKADVGKIVDEASSELSVEEHVVVEATAAQTKKRAIKKPKQPVDTGKNMEAPSPSTAPNTTASPPSTEPVKLRVTKKRATKKVPESADANPSCRDREDRDDDDPAPVPPIQVSETNTSNSSKAAQKAPLINRGGSQRATKSIASADSLEPARGRGGYASARASSQAPPNAGKKRPQKKTEASSDIESPNTIAGTNLRAAAAAAAAGGHASRKRIKTTS